MSDKLRDDRIAKLEKIKALNIDPWGRRYEPTAPIADVREMYHDERPVAGVKIVGRMIANRRQGKVGFINIQGRTGIIQGMMRLDALGEEAYSLYKLLDVGDIIAIEGELNTTRTGELTIFAEKLILMSKSLRPMPEKYHGLRDVETRYRQRYLDLISSEESRQTFINRSLIIRHIRKHLDDDGFIEVETPMMHTVAGGAAAVPFTTHHNALDLDLFLRIAPELHLKRLLVGGLERVYEINRNFRNEGISQRHNPEFTMLELYQAFGDLDVMMVLCETLVSGCAQAVMGTMKVTYGGHEIDLTPPWKRIDYADALKQYAGIDFRDEAAVMEAARKHDIPTDGLSVIEAADKVFGVTVDHNLVQPTFLLHHPSALSPLSKVLDDDPEIGIRFEAFIGGIELANAYTELNDPLEQAERFENQSGGDPGALDDDFILALEHGLPPAGGMGIGIDRLAMILLDRQQIRDVILFPLLRPGS